MRIKHALLLSVLLAGLGGCSQRSDPVPPVAHTNVQQPVPTTSTTYENHQRSGGVGLTYTGRMGIDLGGGLVMTPSGVGLGFGL